MSLSVSDEFLQLTNENIGIAYKISRIYGDDAESREDIHQEMMYQLWKSYESFDGRSKFSTWMYRVCLNTALTYRRKSGAGRKERLTKEHEEIPEQGNTIYADEMKLLHDGIKTLSAVDKAIVLLYLDDMTYDEIANLTGLTKTNVSVKLVRLKKHLETFIKQRLDQ